MHYGDMILRIKAVSQILIMTEKLLEDTELQNR